MRPLRAARFRSFPPDSAPRHGNVLVKLHDRQPVPVFAGPAPGFPGVYQINVVVPADLPTMTTELQVCGYGASNPNQPVCSASFELSIQQPQQ